MTAARIEDMNAGFAQVAQDFVTVDAKAEAAKDDWAPLGSVRASRYGGIVPAATALPGAAIDLEAQQWDDDAPTGYFNIYGASKYRKALHKRVQVTGSDPNPLLAYHKFSTADRSVDPSAWDQGGYFSIHSTGGSAYRAGLTGFARAMPGATGDHIGVHGRCDVRDPNARGYGVWAYGADLTPAGNAEACHGIEVNGQCTNDPGYGSNHQLIRLCMADNDTSGNRYGSAITIGNPTHGGPAGFHAGIWVQSNAILGSTGEDGEAMRVDARTNNTLGSTGGIRFAKASPSHTGVFKYALRTDEGTFSGNETVVLGIGQRISWFSDGARATSFVGGDVSVTLNDGNLSIPDVAANGVAVAVAGARVLSTRQAAITNAVGGTEVTTINAILEALRTHGLIAT